MSRRQTFLMITGTNTGVGKTVVAAAVARRALDLGVSVCVIKPAQTGVAPSDSSPGANSPSSLVDADVADQPDISTIERLSGCSDMHQLVTLADPLAPDTAARLRGLTLPSVEDLSRRASSLATGHGLALVEGSGGVAVRLDTAGGTLLDMASCLVADGHRVEFILVTSLALGTLNSTELTLQALAAAKQTVAGLVLGAVPAQLDIAERCNLEELPRVTGLKVLGAIPDGVGAWEPARFQAACHTWLTLDPLLRSSTPHAGSDQAPEPLQS